jgi:hypothetical protein
MRRMFGLFASAAKKNEKRKANAKSGRRRKAG